MRRFNYFRKSLLNVGNLLLFAFGLFENAVWGQVSNLHASAHWSALLHLDRSGTSQVKDPSFWLSPQAVAQPEAELDLLLSKLDSPDEKAVILRRFPARVAWLEQETGRDFGTNPDVERAWKTFQPDTVTLVYASEHMGHAASLFGHLFLVFEKTGKSRLLSQACNFAGDLGGGLSPIRGLFGSLPGYVVLLPYDEKIRDYSDLEHRDLWEYQLKLRQEEVRRLFLHIWELQSVKFDYNFFNANCASQIISLLKVARPEADWHRSSAIVDFPQDTLQAAYEVGLVRKRRFRPSLARQIDHATSLSVRPQNSRLAALKWIESETTTVLDDTQLELAALLLQSKRLKQPDAHADRFSTVLSRLASLEIPKSEPPVPEAAPERASLARQAGLSLLWEGGEEELQAAFDIRLGYRDLLDWPAGTGLEFLELGVLASEDELRLERAMLVDVQTLPAYEPVFRQSTWRFRLGMEPFYHEDYENKSLGTLELAKGRRLGDGYVQAGLSLFTDLDSTHYYGPQVTAGVLLPVSRGFRSHIQARINGLSDGDRFETGTGLDWQSRFRPWPKRAPHLDLDAQLSLRGDGEIEVRLGLRRPWGVGSP